MKQNTKDGWVVWVNKDLTEGRGIQYAKYVCESNQCAKRLAEGADVQGTNGRITKVTLIEGPGDFPSSKVWYGPVFIRKATEGDIALEELNNKKQRVIDKAIAAGLTPEELEILNHTLVDDNQFAKYAK